MGYKTFWEPQRENNTTKTDDCSILHTKQTGPLDYLTTTLSVGIKCKHLQDTRTACTAVCHMKCAMLCAMLHKEHPHTMARRRYTLFLAVHEPAFGRVMNGQSASHLGLWKLIWRYVAKCIF